MTRVIHTGDTHLGYRQYHSPERRRDFLAAFRRVARDAIEADVDAVVHAGDLFHDRRPELPDLLGTLSVLRELDEADIPFLAIVGNHETKRDAQWLDLFASLDLATRLGDEPFVVGDVALYGLDYVPPSRREALDYEFASHDSGFAALVAHGLFQPFDLGDWDAEAVLDASSVAFDAMLLGDNHKPDIRRSEGGTWLTYCGSTERASADEREERGYNLVTFEDGEVTVSRRGLPTREFVFVDVKLDEDEGHARIRERVGQHDVEDAVAIVTIEGEGEPVAPADVEELLRDAGALVARVNDRREIEADEGEIEVSFADPDEAVRERVREMGLSPAAGTIDEVVRASKVADTNVAETVERRVTDLLESDDDAAFAPAPEPTVESRTAADRMADRAGDDEADADDEPDEEAEPAVREVAEGGSGAGEPRGAEAGTAEAVPERETATSEAGEGREGDGGDEENEPNAGSDDEDHETTGTDEQEDPPTPSADGQTSWSDYE
jgi:DNA repair exonuclease SbcCD nuclease subunit